MNAYLLGFLATLLMVSARLACGQSATNTPPLISIIWPGSGAAFSSEFLKIKVHATDPDGFVTQVRFYANTNLIGIATEPPFSMVSPPNTPDTVSFKAVAIDNLGAQTESRPVPVYRGLERPVFPVVAITWPQDRQVFSAPATFLFSAEVLASMGDAGPVEFLIGTNSLGFVEGSQFLTSTTPASSIAVTNLPKGEYRLSVRYHGGNGQLCTCSWEGHATIRVTELGVSFTRLTSDGDVEFEVVTSFPNVETIIEASPNLRDWDPINTNVPSGNAFLFTDPNPASLRRFYRVVVNSE